VLKVNQAALNCWAMPRRPMALTNTQGRKNPERHSRRRRHAEGRCTRTRPRCCHAHWQAGAQLRCAPPMRDSEGRLLGTVTRRRRDQPAGPTLQDPVHRVASRKLRDPLLSCGADCMPGPGIGGELNSLQTELVAQPAARREARRPDGDLIEVAELDTENAN